MAVFPDLPGFEAKVLIDGVICAEHSAPDDDEGGSKSVTKYIEAKPGATFEVHVFIYPEALALRRHDICASVKVDGRIVRKPFWSKGQDTRQARVVKSYQGPDSMGWSSRDLIFSDLRTDDNSGGKFDKKLKEQVDKLGQITIEFFRTKVKGQVEARPYGWSDDLPTVPKKAMKGNSLSHRASLGTASAPFPTPQRYSADHIDATDEPYASICFHYRSLGDLKTEMVIPRSPSPVPLNRRKFESLSREEMIELLEQKDEQAARIEQERIRVKRERASSPATVHEDDEDLSIVEPSPKRRRAAETIDLTDD